MNERPPARYVLDLDAKVTHRVIQDRGYGVILAACNVDQIVAAQKSDVVPYGFRRCEHCFKDGAVVAP